MSPNGLSDNRRRDLLALGLILVGAGLFAVGFSGLRELHTHPIVLQRGQTAYSIFLRYYLLSGVGLLLVLAGLGTAIWAYLRGRAPDAAKQASPGAPPDRGDGTSATSRHP